jgi:hypothetical protein
MAVGATIAAMMKATGWQYAALLPCCCRAAKSGTLFDSMKVVILFSMHVERRRCEFLAHEATIPIASRKLANSSLSQVQQSVACNAMHSTEDSLGSPDCSAFASATRIAKPIKQQA